MTTPKMQPATIKTLVILGQAINAGLLPAVPTDRKEVVDAAAGANWRITEANREEALNGLREVVAHPGELGDLGPSAENCARVSSELESIYASLTRLKALQEYIEARRALLEPKADKMLRDIAEEATRRIERGFLGADRYRSACTYASAHSAAISQGIARAARIRAGVQRETPAEDPQPTKP